MTTTRIEEKSWQDYYQLGNKLYNQEKWDEAIAAFNQSLLLKPDNIDTLYMRGRTYVNLKQNNEAQADFDKIMHIYPVNYYAHYLYGLGLRAMEKYHESLVAFNECLKLKPDYEHAFIDQGWSYINLNQYDEANLVFEKAIELQHSHRAYYNYGAALYSMKQYEEAIMMLNKSLELDPNYHHGYYYKGFALLALGNKEEAEKCFKQCIEVAPDNYTAWYNYAVGLSSLKKYKDCLYACEKALEWCPGYRSAVQLKKVTEEKIKFANENLLTSAKNGDVEKIKEALGQGADIECCDADQYKPLYLSTLYANNETIEFLLDQGANIYGKNGAQATSLHVASSRGKLDAIKVLVDRNSKLLEERDHCGLTPLHYAVFYPQLDSIKLLLKLGANIEAKTIVTGRIHHDDLTPLEMALSIHHADPATDAYFKADRNRDRSQVIKTLIDYEINSRNQTIEDILDVFLRRYNECFYRIGRTLYQYRQKLSANITHDTSLKEALPKAEESTKQLIAQLDRLELYRNSLNYLCEAMLISINMKDKIEQLDSKETILQRTMKFYDKADKSLLIAAAEGDVEQFTHALNNGANVNQWDDWGQAVHHIPDKRGKYKNQNDAIKLMHQLLKSGDELEKSNGTKMYKEGDTVRNALLRTNIIPIKWMLNNSQFDLALLYCASGYDVIESQERVHNALFWFPTISLQQYFVKEMNKEDSMLYKERLRDAYVFYKAIEAGQHPSTANIQQASLLWIVCILGDLKALDELPCCQITVNMILSDCKFTPLMMAVHCGNEKVVQYLLQRGANINARCLAINASPTALWLAINRKSWVIAQMLINAGMKPTEIQEKQVNEELKKITITEEQSIMLRNAKSVVVTPDPEIIQAVEEFLKQNQQADVQKLEQQIKEQAEQLQNLQGKLEHEKQQHDKEVGQLHSRIDELKSKEKTEQQFFDGVLLNAAEKGSIKKINSTLDFDANIKTTNDKGQTALHLSIVNNHNDTADFILTKEPELFIIADKIGFTPIQQVAKNGQLEMLDWLYEKGKAIPGFNWNQEEFDKVYNVATPEVKQFLVNKRLLESAKTGKIEGVRDALSKGASLDVKAHDGDTALHKAVYFKYKDIAHLLLAQGANPTIRNNKHHEEIGKHHETVLDIAKITKDNDLISMVATPFLICAAQHSAQPDILTALNAGANLIGIDSNGQTALHKATLVGNTEVIKLLLKKHAEAKLDIHLPDKNGNTPYQLALKAGSIVKTKTGEKKLEIYMLEKFGAYKKEIKLLEKKTTLSNSTHSFVASVGQGEGNSPSALNNTQELNPAIGGQSEGTQFNIEKKFAY